MSYRHYRYLLLGCEIFFYYLFGLELSHRFIAFHMTGLKIFELSHRNANNFSYPHKWRHHDGFIVRKKIVNKK